MSYVAGAVHALQSWVACEVLGIVAEGKLPVEDIKRRQPARKHEHHNRKLH